MNIAVFTDTYFPDINGVASSISAMIEGLRQKGHKVFVFCISEPSRKITMVSSNPPVFRVPSIPVFFAKPYRAVLPELLPLIEMCKKYKIDIVHSHTEFSMGLMGGMVANCLGLPQIHTYHTMWEDYTHHISKGHTFPDRQFKSLARKYSKYFCSHADALIVPTAKVYNYLTSKGVDVLTFQIPSGIDLKDFRRDLEDPSETLAIREKFGLFPDDKVLLSIGRIAFEKSLDLIIRAMPGILTKVPNARLVMIGDGPELKNLRDLVNELGLGSSVILPGPVAFADVHKYYHIGDVFISCSTTETQGLTYYEAMAAGLPVIARYDESLESIIVDGRNGRIFHDPAELPELVSEVLSDFSRDQYLQMSANACESVDPFDIGTFADRIEDAYLKTIEHHAKVHNLRDHNIFRHIGYKLRSGTNTAVTATDRGIRKIFKPLIKQRRNRSRRRRLLKAMKSK